jgi:hypothetical protein
LTGRGPQQRVIAGTITLLAGLLVAAPAGADTIKPTRFDDPTPGKCKPKDCSLREAFRKVGEADNHDTVVLGKGTYEIQIPPTASDPPDSGDFAIASPVTVRGQGPKKTKLDGNGLSRVLIVLETFTDGTVRIQDLTIRGGDAGSNNGGGITTNAEDLVLDHVVIRDNTAQLGGGIRSRASELTIKDSTIAHNSSTEGGGIRSALAPAHSLIRSSTISDNSAGKGGGILADGLPTTPAESDPNVNLVTSTVAGNQATAEAGGIMADNGASVTLGGSTVAYNLANSDGIGSGVAGGIYQHSGASFVFADSILAQNDVGQGGSDPQCSGSFTSQSGAVVEVQPAACTMSGPPSLVGSAKTEPLADNGGPTKTVKILASSPANGNAVECAKRDQRGVKRPADGCDSGAYERKGP